MAESPTLSLLARINAMKNQGKKIFPFHIDEPDFTVSPNVAEAIKRAIDEGKTCCTHQAGLPQLPDAVMNPETRALEKR